MKQRDLILIGILVVQIVLGVVVFWPRPAETAAGEPFFPDLKVSDVTGLSIADNGGDSVRLKIVAGEWSLPDADDYPVQGDKVTSVLEKLLALDTGRQVTRTDSSHKRLQVATDDFLRRIRLETADGKTHTLYVGSSPRYGATHVRLHGHSEVYLTDAISVWEINTGAGDWADRLYLSLPQADLTKITLENAAGELVFTREGTGEGASVWALDGLPEGQTLAENKINLLLNQVTSINIVAPLGKEERVSYRMSSPSAVVTLETSSGTVTIRVGAQDAETSNHFVKASSEPHYVTVADYNVSQLVGTTLEDFLELPPTPAPGEDTNAE